MSVRRITRSDLRGVLVVGSLLLLVATAPLAAQRKNKNQSVGWPFGEAAADSAGGVMSLDLRRDLFNLGLIGAKAWDADRPDPKRRTGSGKQSFKLSKPSGDAGPKRLVLRAILGGGPAQKAGLTIGDVILGVDQTSFEKGSSQPLADALRRAESGSGELMLKVERDGEEEYVKVKIKKGGKDSADPVHGKFRDKIQTKALKWLADRQSSDGGYPQTLGGMNGRITNACLAGLAWIAGGSSQRGGKHRKNILAAVEFVKTGLYAKDPFAGRLSGKGGNWNQTTWAFAHAGIFFGELQVIGKNRKLQPFLQKITDELCRRQEVSGGYAHGPGGKNALNYLELNILGGYVLSALGVAKQAGCKIDAKVTAKLNAYLKASASEGGGVGYSTGEGQIGHGNIGRTAVSWLGAVGLGLGADEWTKKMEGFVREHIADIMHGHASLMQHIMLAGVAAKALGKESSDAYWKVLLRDFTLARSPDGSLQTRPWHESLGMSSNADVKMGEVWSTASWAIVLSADNYKGKKGGLRGWCGKKVK